MSQTGKWQVITLAATLLATALSITFSGAAALSAATSTVTRSSSYQWPVKPFDRPHPVRATFGDPRTVFRTSFGNDPLGGSGSFAFHNGIDIDAPNGTPVYPVVSGTVVPYGESSTVAVAAPDGRSFLYIHIVAAVHPGQKVTAGVTVIGRVSNWAKELHFSEVSAAHRFVNPLFPGHLTPYRDATTPTVVAVHVRDGQGEDVPLFAVNGRVALIAEAYDTPTPVDHSGRTGFALTNFARDPFPLAPATLSWSLKRLSTGAVVVRRRPVADFRRGIPDAKSFWNVYARGTYQNRPAIIDRCHGNLRGRFLYVLAPSFDTRTVHNGVYVLTVVAADVRSHTRVFSERIDVQNDV